MKNVDLENKPKYILPTVLFAFDELSGLLQEFRSFGSELVAPSVLDGPFPLLDGPFVALLHIDRTIIIFFW